MKDYLTIAEAAKKLARSECTVRRWVHDGMLEAHQQANREWRIPASAVENFTPPVRGRPVEGRSIRFKLSTEDGRLLARLATLNGMVPSEMVKSQTLTALNDYRSVKSE